MHTAGAYIAQDFIVRYPQLVSGLAVLGGMMDSKEAVASCESRIPELSSWAQEVIRESEAEDDYESEDYHKAAAVGSTFTMRYYHQSSRPTRLPTWCTFRTVVYPVSSSRLLPGLKAM